MNQDVFEGKWKEIQGQAKEWWGKLTDDDLKQVDGKADQLVGILQQKYGYTKEQAEEELNLWLEGFAQEPVEAGKSPYTTLAPEGTGLDHAMPGEPYKSPYVTSEPEDYTARTEKFKSPYTTPDMTDIREDDRELSPYTTTDMTDIREDDRELSPYTTPDMTDIREDDRELSPYTTTDVRPEYDK